MTIDPEALEAARKAIEDELIEWRDSGRFMLSGNGFTVNHRDGSPGIMRFSTAYGLKIGIEAYLKNLEARGMDGAK